MLAAVESSILNRKYISCFIPLVWFW